MVKIGAAASIGTSLERSGRFWYSFWDMSEQLHPMEANTPASKKIEAKRQRIEQYRDELESRYQARFYDLFKKVKDPAQRVDLVLQATKEYAAAAGMDPVAFETEIRALGALTDQKQFIRNGLQALAPMLEYRSQFADEDEKAAWKNRFSHSHKPLSGAVEYTYLPKFPNEVELHLPPNRDKSLPELLPEILAGLKQLAEVVKQNPDIKEVKGKSWIVEEHPGVVKRFGFEVNGEDAVMTREAFLARYGQAERPS
jgi:hypothetical protein